MSKRRVDQATSLRHEVEKMQEEPRLPSRSEIHRGKGKLKWKIKYPIIHLLVLFIILLPITIYSIYSSEDKVTQEQDFETIDIQKESTQPTVDKHSPTRQVVYHTVLENETLYSISLKYYRNKDGMTIIKNWNKLTSNQLNKGKVLQIPIDNFEK